MGCAKSKNKSQKAQSFTDGRDARKWNPIHIPITQNVLLIWLDPNIDQNNIDHFRHAINNIDTFTDGEKCIQFLNGIATEKACMIISGSLGQEIVPRVHNLSQVDTIFIFCSKQKQHEAWTKNWSKIKGIFTEMKPLGEAVKHAAQQCDQNAMSITIMGNADNPVKNPENRLDPSFMYTQIIKEIFLTIDFDQQHFEQFIQYSRNALHCNDKQLKYVEEIAQQYDHHTPIWWYTRDTYLYAMLNRVLRVMDVDVMIKMGFFIADLHRHIQQLHQKQFGGDHVTQCLDVYRGQGMDKNAFQKMATNSGGLISFNGFLSTSRKHSTSLRFAKQALTNTEVIGVLFVINIDPKVSSTPFASVDEVGYYGAGEQEVLFSMHTVFRIGQITSLGENNRLVQVQLNLASDKDNDLCDLINYIREETSPDSSGYFRLGFILERMGEAAKAQKLFDRLLEQELEEIGKAAIYQQLGVMKIQLGEFEEAIRNYEKRIEIEVKQIPRNDLSLANSYNVIGGIYSKMGDYSKAILFHEKAVEIRPQSLPSTHLEVAASYNNIGLLYCNTNDYPKALSYHEKALEIQQQSLPPTHPDLAASCSNIGNVFHKMGNYLQALSSYEKALEIRQKSLPPTHPDLAASYGNIGIVFDNMGNYPKALSSFEEVLKIQQQSLSPTHPDLAAFFHNIGLVYFNMGDHAKAFSSYEKALEIRQLSLPPTHPDVASLHNNIGNVYNEMHNYAKALSSHEIALEIQQQSLSPTHSDIAHTYHNIGLVYFNMGNYSKALSSYVRAFDIRQQSLPPTHPDVASSYNNIGNVCDAMGDYHRALLCHETALEIKQKSLPSTHPELAGSYQNLGLVYFNMGNYSKALSSYEKALEIRQLSLPPTHPDLAASYSDIGLVYFDMGDYPKAFFAYMEVLTIQHQACRLDDLDLATAYKKLGSLHEYTGNFWKARSYYEHASTLAQCLLPVEHPFLLHLNYDLAHIEQKLQ